MEEIYVRLWGNGQGGLKVFDKKLKKVKWSEPLANGYLNVVSKGLTSREVWTANNLKITCRKKGKKDVSEHNLTEPSGYNLNYEIDKKGGVLYWTEKDGTNSPLTYLDRKGVGIIDNQQMVAVGNVWNFQNFGGNSLYVRKKVSDSVYSYYVYKLKNLTKLGQQDITLPQAGDMADSTSFEKKVYLVPYYNDLGEKYAVYVFDKKLKKEQWKEEYDYGIIWKASKDTLYRRTESTSGGIVTENYKLFNKNGEVVTYTLQYGE